MIVEVLYFLLAMACTVGVMRLLSIFIDWISSDDGYEPIR